MDHLVFIFISSSIDDTYSARIDDLTYEYNFGMSTEAAEDLINPFRHLPRPCLHPIEPWHLSICPVKSGSIHGIISRYPANDRHLVVCVEEDQIDAVDTVPARWMKLNCLRSSSNGDDVVGWQYKTDSSDCEVDGEGEVGEHGQIHTVEHTTVWTMHVVTGTSWPTALMVGNS
ncbi:hypothetical protein MRB53_040039 [Persea americana]|nr:hypothetical protein MRB53_040039 [Persea americana]